MTSRGCSAVRILVPLVTVHLALGHRIMHADKAEQHELHAQKTETAQQHELNVHKTETVRGGQQFNVQDLGNVQGEQRQAGLPDKIDQLKQEVKTKLGLNENVYTRLLSVQGIKDAWEAFTDKDCLSLDIFEYNTRCHRAMPLWNIAVLLAIGFCCCCLGCCLF